MTTLEEYTLSVHLTDRLPIWNVRRCHSAMTNPDTISNESLIGKPIWIEMIKDRSAVVFSRKGVVLHQYAKPLEKEAWRIALDPPPFMLFPFPQRLRNVILHYPFGGPHSLSMTFQTGASFAGVYRIRREEAMTSENLTRRDVSRIGSAFVYEWPKRSDQATPSPQK